VETVSVSELAIELAKARPSVVAFDGDGTLWSGDVGEDFFFGIIAAQAILPEAEVALRRTTASAGVTDTGDASELARRLWDAYLAKQFPEQSMCEVMAWLYAGRTVGEAWALAATFVPATFAERIHPEALAALQAARAAGHRTVVVSASPRPVVEQAAGALGFSSADVFAATPVIERDRVRPDVMRPIPYAQGKAIALTKALNTAPLLAAFGDNVFDTDMLALARWPVAVRPKQRLLDHADAVPGLKKLVLEPRPAGELP
jgi:phosphatidylglycerophosphatase C